MNILIRNVESRYSTRGDCLPSLNRGPSGAVRLPFLIGVCKINLNQFCGHQLGTIEAHFEFIALYHFLTNDREPIRPIFSIGSGGFDALGCENFPPKISDFFLTQMLSFGEFTELGSSNFQEHRVWTKVIILVRHLLVCQNYSQKHSWNGSWHKF